MVPNNFPGGTMVLVQSFPQMMKLAMRCVLGGAEHDGSSDLLSLPLLSPPPLSPPRRSLS